MKTTIEVLRERIERLETEVALLNARQAPIEYHYHYPPNWQQPWCPYGPVWNVGQPTWGAAGSAITVAGGSDGPSASKVFMTDGTGLVMNDGLQWSHT